MPKVVDVPERYAAIRDAIVAYALGEAAGPEQTAELSAFQGWLLYESSAAEGGNYEFVIRLSDLEFEDDGVRHALGLPCDSQITDEQRLEYARQFIDSYGEDGKRTPYSAEGLELQRADWRSTVYCCITQMGGQSGLHPDWYGCYSDLGSFLRFLQGRGWWALKDPAAGIPDARFLELWYHGPGDHE